MFLLSTFLALYLKNCVATFNPSSPLINLEAHLHSSIGFEVPFYFYSYHVYIRISNRLTEKPIDSSREYDETLMSGERCAGVILYDHVILTTASCVIRNGTVQSYLTIVTYSQDLRKVQPESIERRDFKVVVHENFDPKNPRNFDNDIALIHTAEFNLRTVPEELGKAQFYRRKVRSEMLLVPAKFVTPDQEMRVAGWSYLKNGDDAPIGRGKFVAVDTLMYDKSQCQEFSTKYGFTFTDNMICVRAKDSRAGGFITKGDFGSGLVSTAEIEGKRFIYGLASGPIITTDMEVGKDRGRIRREFTPRVDPKAPSIFTNVHNYANWIRETIDTNQWDVDDVSWTPPPAPPPSPVVTRATITEGNEEGAMKRGPG